MTTTLPRNSVRCLRFTAQDFREIVDTASDRTSPIAPSPQLDYLASYLETDIEAGWMVVETHYVDRHFTDELTRYYSSCFRKPASECARIHFFRKEPALDEEAFNELIRLAPPPPDGNGPDAHWRRFNSALSDRYLGFTVIRPLPSVPIGRTVLVPRDDDPARRFQTLVTHTVHFAGWELTVRGVAWQQQDWAVAACATTAIWTALQRVARFEAQRVPTPPEITDAAVRYSVGQQRPLPSPGLTTQQISDALHSFHFGPSCFRVGQHAAGPAMFALTLNIYLRSGIPVILAIKSDEGAHALTAVGYRHDPNAASAYPSTNNDHIDLRAGKEPVRPCNLDYCEVYLHDDRVGPYARGFLTAPNTKELELRIERQDGKLDQFEVISAAAPLYPKVRTDAGELIRVAIVAKSYVHAVAAGEDVAVEMFFDRSGSYLWSLYRPEVDRARLAAFHREVALSRYVAVTRWSIGGSLFMDLVWDTTDRIRGEQWRRHILACICYDEARRDLFNELHKAFASHAPAV